MKKSIPHILYIVIILCSAIFALIQRAEAAKQLAERQHLTEKVDEWRKKAEESAAKAVMQEQNAVEALKRAFLAREEAELILTKCQ